MDSTRFLWDSLPCWHDCISHNLSSVHSCRESPVLPHPKGVLSDSDLVNGKATEEHWTYCHVHETSLRRLLFCGMWACAHCTLSFLFLADRSGTQRNLLLLLPICLKVGRVVQSEMLFCIPQLYRVVIWVTIAFLSARSSLAILRWIVINKAFPSAELLLTGCFFFCLLHDFE